MKDTYVESINSWEGWMALETQWNELVVSSSFPSIYSSFNFLTLAWKHYHSKKSCPLILLIKDRETDAIIGIAPFRIQSFTWFGISLQACEYLVTNDVDKPYIIPLAGQDDRCWFAIGQFMSENSSVWDIFELMEIRDGLTTAKVLQSCFKLPKFHNKFEEDGTGPLIDLTQSWEEFYQGHKKFRKKLRTLEKKLPDGFSFEYINDESRVEASLERYIELEGRSWKRGKIGVSKDEKHLAFYRDLIPTLAEKGQIHFGFLSSGQATISGEMAYSFNDQVYFCHGTFDQNFSEFSPGKVSTGLLIGELTGKQFIQGDFLCGFAGYMSPWSSSHLKTNSLFVYKITPKMLYIFSILATLKVLRPIKQWFIAKKKKMIDK
jgi:hypothetical protein